MKKGRRNVGADVHAKTTTATEHQNLSAQEGINEQESEEAENDEQAPPKLAEGFYEIEDIRRKRVRKGQLQFLIKWRGWPETANTWEPYENIQSCPEIIEAFQQRVNKSSRKRKKRKSSATTTHTNNDNNNIIPSPKKKRTAVYVNSFNGRPNSNGGGEGRGRSNSKSKSNSNADEEEDEGTDCMDREGAANDNSKLMDKLQDNKDKEVTQKNSSQNDQLSNLPPQNGVGLASTQGDVAYKSRVTLDPLAETVSVPIPCPDFPQSADGGRCGGSRRRKSTSVRRFKLEASPSTTNKNKMADKPGYEVVESNDVGVGDRSKLDVPENRPYFTKILKAIELSATVTNNIQRVAARFLALRSDGKEVITDNSYLKLDNPLLLIDYYEQHLRCGPPNASLREGV